ncbi:MAG: metallophosphoesterase family protein [Thaumarchaeota archaeon]|nr:metallophosphoesterase family protein [Nitrososphaerota archaeon]
MKKLAFISDVHANLEALTAVLDTLGEEELVCLGDSVGYGASPNEVVGVLRKRASLVLLGNHDNAALAGDVSLFNPRAAMGAQWTARELTPESRGFLASKPSMMEAVFEGVRFRLVHGSPDDPLREYVDPLTHSKLFGHYLTKLGVGAIALGHTHIPYTWTGTEGTVFNPGSVGQPRDGDWRASFALVTVQERRVTVEHRRVAYDWELAAQKIRDAGLPEQFASRLSQGF